jgi:hypothetical protein
METRRKGSPRAFAAEAIAAQTPGWPESPAAAEAAVRTPETEPTRAPQAAVDATPDEIVRFAREAFAALADSQATTARSLSALSDAIAGLLRSGIDIAARTATDALEAKTLADACEVNVRFARRTFDGWFDGSAKLSGLGIELAAEASRPLIALLGRSWPEVPAWGR